MPAPRNNSSLLNVDASSSRPSYNTAEPLQGVMAIAPTQGAYDSL